jgi:DNA topoisomerase-6 subunit A
MAAKKKTLAKAPAKTPTARSGPRSATDEKTLTKIERLAQGALRMVSKGDNPALSIRVRALSNVSFNEKKRIIELGERAQSREFFNTSMARKFMQTFLVANGCKQLIDENKTVSIRQMFYMTKHTIKGTSENTFEEQGESDPIIEDLEVSADALREELHLFADKKGTLAGPMVIDDSGDRIDLSRMGRGGWSIPSISEPSVIKFIKNDAAFILFVEKSAIWERLNEDRFWKNHKCILMTTAGQATRGARRLLQRMATELKLPVFVLVDNDPWGLYIYSVLKQGSISLAYESMRLAVPNVRFLGMSSLDHAKFELPSAVEIKLNDKDIDRAKQMKAYPWFKDKKWQKEMDALLHNGFKMELDGLLTKGISFISEEYIPKKLKDRDYLE